MADQHPSGPHSMMLKITRTLLIPVIKKTYPHRYLLQMIFVVLWVIFLISGIAWYYRYTKMMRRQPSLEEQIFIDTKDLFEQLLDDEPIEADQYCQIMRPHPLDPATLLQVSRPPPLRCHWKTPQLTFIGEDGKLLYNKSALKEVDYDNQHVKCYYCAIPRSYPVENSAMVTLPQYIKGNDTLSDDFVVVRCKNFAGVDVYANMHAYPQMLRNPPPPRSSPNKLSVLLFSLDSLSRLTMMQQLPKTYLLLTRVMGAEVLQGMTKVGDGSWENIGPMLTGRPVIKRKKNSDRNKSTAYSLIWSNYSAERYVTFLAEDVASSPLFVGMTPDYLDHLPDHWLHPFWEAMEHTEVYNESLPMCYGNVPLHLLHLNYVKNFARKYASTPYFAFSHITGVKQRCMNCLSLLDDDLYQFLADLFFQGYLNNTIMFITSDHGVLLDDFTSSVGRIESNKPIGAVFLPLNIREEMPEVVKNLRANSLRLTSSFDVHASLVDILDYASNKSQRLGMGNEKEQKQGYSLFGPISKNRSCSDAGISGHYCVCGKEQSLSTEDEHVTEVAYAIIKTINRFVATFPSKCAVLHSKAILSAAWIVDRVYNRAEKTISDNSLMRVVVQTSPGGGIFEGIGRFTADNEIKVETDISRLNSFAGQDACVTKKMQLFYNIQKYCFCNNAT